ncbi:uncharacterized protein LTR77_001966 [Saxophila tyrrhenica]|uniref:Uncharacterized protein n=1 Tax=Saxophila tyrrhenica TaxID=1690608 RepID=A0AAV9PHV0_9PEZI|nr:hypothetical protein LTR77_001966 [Saxophila tyrrhenica]
MSDTTTSTEEIGINQQPNLSNITATTGEPDNPLFTATENHDNRILSGEITETDVTNEEVHDDESAVRLQVPKLAPLTLDDLKREVASFVERAMKRERELGWNRTLKEVVIVFE